MMKDEGREESLGAKLEKLKIDVRKQIEKVAVGSIFFF